MNPLENLCKQEEERYHNLVASAGANIPSFIANYISEGSTGLHGAIAQAATNNAFKSVKYIIETANPGDHLSLCRAASWAAIKSHNFNLYNKLIDLRPDISCIDDSLLIYYDTLYNGAEFTRLCLSPACYKETPRMFENTLREFHLAGGIVNYKRDDLPGVSHAAFIPTRESVLYYLIHRDYRGFCSQRNKYGEISPELVYYAAGRSADINILRKVMKDYPQYQFLLCTLEGALAIEANSLFVSQILDELRQRATFLGLTIINKCEWSLRIEVRLIGNLNRSCVGTFDLSAFMYDIYVLDLLLGRVSDSLLPRDTSDYCLLHEYVIEQAVRSNRELIAIIYTSRLALRLKNKTTLFYRLMQTDGISTDLSRFLARCECYQHKYIQTSLISSY